MNKYRNKKTGYFDSKKESQRYNELFLLHKSGLIKNLKRQVTFILIPSQKDVDGRTIERSVKYIADFTYYDKDGRFIVEDVKSAVTRTKDYIIKRKLMLFIHKIKIKEV